MKYCFLIVGATSDLGTRLSFYFAKNGHDLIILDLDEMKLLQLADSLDRIYPSSNVSCCLVQPTIEGSLALSHDMDGLSFDSIIVPFSTREFLNQMDEVDRVEKIDTIVYEHVTAPNLFMRAVLPHISEGRLKSVVLASDISGFQAANLFEFDTFKSILSEWNSLLEGYAEKHNSNGIRFGMFISDTLTTAPFMSHVVCSLPSARGVIPSTGLRLKKEVGVFSPYQVFGSKALNFGIDQLLLHVVKGEQHKVSVLLRKNPFLLKGKTTVVDHAGRIFKMVSSFQYALWARDIQMWQMMESIVHEMHDVEARDFLLDALKFQLEELEDPDIERENGSMELSGNC